MKLASKFVVWWSRLNSPGAKLPAFFRASKYVGLFVLIQLVNIPLAILGWFICLSPALARASWLWWNDDDGSGPGSTWWAKYVWLAWRNPVANLRKVKGVSSVGRPLFYRTWGSVPRQYYFKAGWMSDGYPALSAGSGKGF
jgi:hypothetical protein